MYRILLVSLLLVSSSYAEDYYKRANAAAEKAFDDMDCDFGDCKKEEPKPQVIIKEKIVEKPVIVEKVIVQEKVVEKEVPVERVVEKVVYKDKPVTESKPEVVSSNRHYNKLYIDVAVPGDPTFYSDYLSRTQRASGVNWNPVKKALLNAPEKGSDFVVKIVGFIEVPASINSEKIYIKPLGKDITKYLVIDGNEWKSAQLMLENGYKETRKIPFYYKYSSYYKSSLINTMTNQMADISFLISNKPTERGEEKNYVKARVFIEE
ncbi:hypothetical protein [Sulfurimonas sp.]|uniref:hypothetical protein n=1 Tax=Sulfurimonas sp. TaxID=2022749 RepID=UPI003568E976